MSLSFEMKMRHVEEISDEAGELLSNASHDYLIRFGFAKLLIDSLLIIASELIEMNEEQQYTVIKRKESK